MEELISCPHILYIYIYMSRAQRQKSHIRGDTRAWSATEPKEATVYRYGKKNARRERHFFEITKKKQTDDKSLLSLYLLYG